jgi:hypothetical protein
MGEMTTLTAEDTHKLAAYRATPADAPRGALVVVQEIWDRIKKAHPTLPMHVYPGAATASAVTSGEASTNRVTSSPASEPSPFCASTSGSAGLGGRGPHAA